MDVAHRRGIIHRDPHPANILPDPARRYPDVAALAEDLRRFQAGEPIVARPVSDAEWLWRWCLRNRRVAALGAAVAVLLVVVTVVSATAAVMVNGKNRELGEAN